MELGAPKNFAGGQFGNAKRDDDDVDNVDVMKPTALNGDISETIGANYTPPAVITGIRAAE